MLWSLNRVLMATVRGARNSRVSLISGILAPSRADVDRAANNHFHPFRACPARGA
jgi:hypothetical protein